MEQHWTSESVEAFIHRITFDFITQLLKKLEAGPMTQSQLADRLKVSEAAVSQVLNSPHNLKMKTIVRYARALGLKVAVVAYDDLDPDNKRGPVNSEIFATCWEQRGRPHDFRWLGAPVNSRFLSLPFQPQYVLEGTLLPMEAGSHELRSRPLPEITQTNVNDSQAISRVAMSMGD